MTDEQRAAIESIKQVAHTFQLVLAKRLRAEEHSSNAAFFYLEETVRFAEESIEMHGAKE